MSKPACQEGFTLLEVLLSLALSGVMFLGLITFFWFGLNGLEQGSIKADLQYSARQARSKVLEDFRQSNNFSIKDKGGNVIAPGGQGECLYLIMYSGEELKYFVRQGQLYREILNKHAAPQPVASDITSIAFGNPVLGLLEINIAAARGNQTITSYTTCTSWAQVKAGDLQ